MSVDVELARGQLLAVLAEARNGPPAVFAYLSDRGPAAGWHALLASVDADEARREVSGASLATEAQHLAFGLRAVASFIGGDWTRADWAQSWQPRPVDAAGWQALQDELAAAFLELESVVAKSSLDAPQTLGGALGAVAHVAYHLGAVKERLAGLRGGR